VGADASTSRPQAAARSPASAGSILPLVVAIATTILCVAVPFGVPAIAYALRARSAQDAGATEIARSRRRMSLVLSALGIVLGSLVEIYALVRHLAGGFQ
jgi:hypothetical protein